MPLTDTSVRSAKPAAKAVKLFDSSGMYLEVAPAGGKWWRLKYRFGGKEKRLSLGVYPDVSLRDARNAENGLLCARMDADSAVIEELHSHVADLRRDLKQSQEKAARVESKLDAAKQAAHAQAVELKTELATRVANLEGATEQAARAQLEREQVLRSLSEAREQAGELRGRVEALTRQNADLLAAIAIK